MIGLEIGIIALIIIVIIILLVKNKSSISDDDLKRIKKIMEDNKSQEIYYTELRDRLDKLQRASSDLQITLTKSLNDEFKSINKLMQESDEKSNRMLKDTLTDIRKDNSEKLDKIKEAVDENLKKTLEDRLNKSFSSVFDQINNLNKTIGEIKNIAGDVSSLKNVMANVKVKGILGEVILGNLIKEILTTGQYVENFSAKNNKEFVEFAIKMPGNDGEDLYLQIDSKFPTESYNRLLEAIEESDKSKIAEERKELKRQVIKCASDISSKYINEPKTTGFAIMFLPIEGLYAEVINLGVFEELENKYKVIVAGPSTLSALLNALQMGFKTLMIQKKSAEVFNLLSAVKTEFNKFAEALDKTQKKFNEASTNLEELVGTRTRVMSRTLNKVEELPEADPKLYFNDKI